MLALGLCLLCAERSWNMNERPFFIVWFLASRLWSGKGEGVLRKLVVQLMRCRTGTQKVCPTRQLQGGENKSKKSKIQMGKKKLKQKHWPKSKAKCSRNELPKLGWPKKSFHFECLPVDHSGVHSYAALHHQNVRASIGLHLRLWCAARSRASDITA
eukprot:4533627-Amphidinium_carterae.1